MSIVKNKTAFSGYARSYKIEIADNRDVVVQLKVSKISIVELFKKSLTELKGLKYQTTLCVLLSKVKSSDLIEYSPVHFNSLTKRGIGDGLKLDQYFNEIIYRLESWKCKSWKWMDC